MGKHYLEIKEDEVITIKKSTQDNRVHFFKYAEKFPICGLDVDEQEIDNLFKRDKSVKGLGKLLEISDMYESVCSDCKGIVFESYNNSVDITDNTLKDWMYMEKTEAPENF